MQCEGDDGVILSDRRFAGADVLTSYTLYQGIKTRRV